MNKRTLTNLAFACVLAYAPQPAQANTDYKAHLLTFLENISASYLKDHPTKPKMTEEEKAQRKTEKHKVLVETACKKGNASANVFSVRSGEGIACNDPFVAAWAILNCGNFDNFDNSGCKKKANSALEKEVGKKTLKSMNKDDIKTYFTAQKKSVTSSNKDAL